MIYLVRHGETRWNVERRLQGRLDSGLTALGRRQGIAMAELLAELVERDGPAPWRLVSSPLPRARQTAEPIAARLGLPLELDERIVEVAFGDWEGRLLAEIMAEHGGVKLGRELVFGSPGGETFEAAQARIDSFLAELPPEPERRAIVVCHGVVSRLIRGGYAGLDRQATLMLDVPHGSVYRLADGQVDRFDCEPLDETA
jgi:probable phosphoglycerate mutase